MALKNDKTRILVNLPVELKKQVEAAAVAQNRSVSNYIVTLIQQEMDRNNKIQKA